MTRTLASNIKGLPMYDLLAALPDSLGPILLIAGALLIIVDYAFPTDIACQFGYVCLAAAVFLIIDGLSLQACSIIALAVWIALLVAHFTFLHRLLDNVPDAPENVPADADA